MSSSGESKRVFTNVAIIGLLLSMVHLSYTLANDTMSEVIGKKYISSLDSSASFINHCSQEAICAINNPQIVSDGTASTPVMQISYSMLQKT